MFGRVDQPLTEEKVREALKAVKFPGFSRDIVSFGIVKSIHVAGSDIDVALHVVTRDPAIPQQIEHDVRAALEGLGRLKVEMTAQQPPQQGMPISGAAAPPSRPHIEGVKHVIAIAS